jgi:alkylhydroperoxidase family enzyme
MARLPYIEPVSAPPATRRVFEQLPLELNIFKMMAHAETCFEPWLRLGVAILSEQQLDARLRELIILRIARLSPAEYEWVQHEPIARATGVTDSQIHALAEDDITAVCFDEVERLVLRFTTEVVVDVKASDETFVAMQRHFSAREIVEALLAIGFYMTVARLAESTATDVDGPGGQTVVAALKERPLR